jgi:hypothetical protein
MATIRQTIAGIAVTVGVGAAAYHLLLNDRAREDLKSAALSTYQDVYATTRKVMGIVNERLNAIPSDGEENRLRTREQWEAIGY